MTATKKIQYACAVCLILSSICMVAYQVIEIDDVANGLLFYVGQAFLLAGSIFGLKFRAHHLVGSNFLRTFASEIKIMECPYRAEICQI